jgi:hypothetical protein
MKDDKTVAAPEPGSSTYPYTYEEFAAISARLPSLPIGIIAAANEYVQCSAAGFLEPGSHKQNARDEITRLSKWVKEGQALACLGSGAREHLARKRQERRFPTSFDKLLVSLYAFEGEHRVALSTLPDGPARGPKTRLAEEHLIYRFWTAWSMAKWDTPQCEPPIRGWPAFLRLCVTPLEKFGLPKISSKGWEERLLHAKKRWGQTPG